MEYPKHPGGTEECSSNESGWTMYIGSPYRDYDNDDDEGTPSKGYKNADHDHVEDGGSDDSMTSDASSGPSHQGVCTNIEQSYGKHEYKHAEKDTRKFSSKEQQKQAKKKLSEKNIKAAKEDSGHKAKSGKGYGYCRSTTRGKH
ncbi:hypothetical protein RND71_002836 [Anisodus tanguticus]|uniref:Uncharacterized protein n=1 Tax=Anisodus tanguticus TaxID=243964 RepID=A0AAE1VWS8_9SOLA|nr:hypothetical protein RND71_002836 [Anisodus tanguticus]